MACSVYKVFTRERGTYQDVNGIQEYFRDYINNNLQLIIDCVSTNTALKVVKRDASGNFAAGTITANLTGDVTGNVSGNTTGDVIGGLTGNVTGNCSGSSGSCTGNAATATIADAAKGDTRFQVSFSGVSSSVPAGLFITLATFVRSIPAGKVLKIKRIGYNISTSSALHVLIQSGTASWESSSASGEDTPNAIVSSGTGIVGIFVYIKNTDSISHTTNNGCGVWIDFALE